MNCPTCGKPSRVLETRHSGKSMRRRRACLTCREKFTSMEIVVGADRQWFDAAIVILPHRVARELRGALDMMVDALDRGVRRKEQPHHEQDQARAAKTDAVEPDDQREEAERGQAVDDAVPQEPRPTTGA